MNPLSRILLSVPDGLTEDRVYKIQKVGDKGYSILSAPKNICDRVRQRAAQSQKAIAHGW